MRVDTAMYSDAVVPPHYDSLIAKLIVHAPSRAEAIARMRRALEMFVIEGVKTTIPLHRRIMDDPQFQSGDLHTGFLDHLLAPAERA